MPGYKRKRGKDAWYLEVTIGTDFRGKPIRYNKTVHCRSEREAEKELARFYTECEDGKICKQGSDKIGPFCDTYYEEYATRFLKKTTLSGTRTAIKMSIKPLLGSIKVTALSRLDVQQWINALSDSGLSPKTIRNRYSVLCQIMSYAIDMGLIDDTPCRNIRLPKTARAEAKYYDMEDVHKLLDALSKVEIEDLTFKVAILVLLFGGLRKGELLGLNWDDVSFKDNTIHIHRARYVAPGEGIYEDTPKTASSIRYVTLPKEIMMELRILQVYQKERRLLLGPCYEDSPAVFRGPLGGPIYPNSLWKWFTAFSKDNGLPELGLHGLRHTHASMLANANTDKVQISERLGHSELTTTLNIYTHLFEDADQQVADTLSEKYLSVQTAK